MGNMWLNQEIMFYVEICHDFVYRYILINKFGNILLASPNEQIIIVQMFIVVLLCSDILIGVVLPIGLGVMIQRRNVLNMLKFLFQILCLSLKLKVYRL